MSGEKKERKALGRGLSALISTPIQQSGNEAVSINSIFNKNFEKEKELEKAKNNKNLLVAISNDNVEEKATGIKALEEKKQDETISSKSKKENAVQNLADVKNQIINVSIDKVCVNTTQPREKFEEKNLKELATSIKKYGIIQPILVREKGDKYEIVAGERRFRASKLAGLKEVPVILQELQDNDAYEIAVIENIQRQNLNVVEEAKAYQKIIKEQGITQQELSEKMGKDRSTISNLLRILELSPEIQQMLKDEKLTLGHAKVLLSLKEKSAQNSLAKKTVQEALSIKELEKLVSNAWILDAGKAYKESKKKNKNDEDLEFNDVIDTLRQKLGTRVSIKQQKNGKGFLKIEYYSKDELERVIQIITKD